MFTTHMQSVYNAGRAADVLDESKCTPDDVVVVTGDADDADVSVRGIVFNCGMR